MMTAMTQIETGYHYDLMRRAIERLDGADGRELTLEEIAAEMHMSPAHFQRIFSRWAGVSPKRYQQWLRLDHAKALLATRHTTLETADLVGLSGGGRLHDLFVRWEAMSPGDYAKGGAGLEISLGLVRQPVRAGPGDGDRARHLRHRVRGRGRVRGDDGGSAVEVA